MGPRMVIIGVPKEQENAFSVNFMNPDIQITTFDDAQSAYNHILRSETHLIMINLCWLSPEKAKSTVSNLRRGNHIPIICIVPTETTVSELIFSGADMCIRSTEDCDFILGNCYSALRRYLDYNQCCGRSRERSVMYRGDIVIDSITHRCFLRGKEIKLLPRVYRLLLLLAGNPETVFSKEMICRNLWPNEGEPYKEISGIVYELRKALEDDCKSPKYIETVHGVGYRFMSNIR